MIIHRNKLEQCLDEVRRLEPEQKIGDTIYHAARLEEYLEIILEESLDEKVRLEWGE